MAAKQAARRRKTALAGLAGLRRDETAVSGRAILPGLAWRTGLAWVVGVIGVLCAVLGVVACSSGPARAGATGTTCGTTRTAANVPVQIQVTKGTVSCGTVLRVERDYATLVRDGDVRGNGGGAPVAVDGWTCEGYTTPVALRTGDASECHTASAEVVAVLALPSPTASAAAAGG